MRADARFLNQPKSFWAHVRSVSQQLGYTERGKGTIKVPTLPELLAALQTLRLTTAHLCADGRMPTGLGSLLLDYFKYRADLLNKRVESLLMDAPAAGQVFSGLCAKYGRKASTLPMNKQKGNKKKNAFLTGMVNMLI